MGFAVSLRTAAISCSLDRFSARVDDERAFLGRLDDDVGAGARKEVDVTRHRQDFEPTSDLERAAACPAAGEEMVDCGERAANRYRSEQSIHAVQPEKLVGGADLIPGLELRPAAGQRLSNCCQFNMT